MLTLALLAITFHTDFESGSLGKVDKVSETHFRCAVKGEADQNGRNRQASWYYFRIDGAAGRELTIDLVDLTGEYNYHPGTHAVTKDTRPVYSYDGKTWTHFERIEWNEKDITLRLRFTPERSPVWIAHIPPYTNRNLEDLLHEFRQNPNLKREVVGKSAGGRDILLLTLTDGRTDEGSKKVVWLVARQHSWEAGTSWTTEGALRFLLSSDAAARAIRNQFVFKVIPIADPDGVARGGVRFNSNGYDLNRNWDAVDPKLMPEIAAMRKSVLDWVDSGHRIDLLLALHNQEGQDLLEGPLEAGGPEFRKFAETLFAQLETKTIFYSDLGAADSGLTTDPGLKGRMAMYQGLWQDRKIRALLLELTVERIPKIDRPPTIRDRMEFGAGLIRAVAASLANGDR